MFVELRAVDLGPALSLVRALTLSVSVCACVRVCVGSGHVE